MPPRTLSLGPERFGCSPSFNDFLSQTSGDWNTDFTSVSSSTNLQVFISFISDSPTCPKSDKDYQETIVIAVEGCVDSSFVSKQYKEVAVPKSCR